MANIEEIKATRAQEKVVITHLKAKIVEINDLCGLDEERMVKRIQTAVRSEYGRVNGLVNLLASVTKWPAEQGDGASVAVNQALIETELNLDLMLLEDIATFRGFHSFATDELDIITGTEPDYENYEAYCTILLQELGFDNATSATIKPASWLSKEQKAIKKAKADIEELKEAIEEHKALMENDEVTTLA